MTRPVSVGRQCLKKNATGQFHKFHSECTTWSTELLIAAIYFRAIWLCNLSIFRTGTSLAQEEMDDTRSWC